MHISQITTSPEALNRSMFKSLRDMVRAEVVTEDTPEFLEYAANDGLTFDEFLADHTFICPILGKPFLFDHGVELGGEWFHKEADLVEYI